MIKLALVGCLIFVVAVTMTMVGKGGGNFYVVILALADVPMHEAATTGQFILFCASVAGMIIFHKNKVVAWPLAVLIGSVTALSALAGGYLSHLFSGSSLKLIFAIMLFVAGAIMLVPVSKRALPVQRGSPGFWHMQSGNENFVVNLWLALPVSLVTGFCSGMVGVSGGSFLVPLMVMACGVPMYTAVGTASTLIAATALMGFSGHAIQGDFNPSWAVPLAFITVLGGILGSKFALQTKPKKLKQLFAYTNWGAAFFMVVNALNT